MKKKPTRSAALKQLKVYPDSWIPGLFPLCSPSCDGSRHAGEGPCSTPGKRPWHSGFYDDARARYRAFAEEPAAAVSMRNDLAQWIVDGHNLGFTGSPLMVCVDADDEVTVEWVREHRGKKSPVGLRHGASEHTWFVFDPNEFEARSTGWKDLDLGGGLTGKLDLRVGGTGFAVVYPSVHADGIPYKWKGGFDPQPIPEMIKDAIRPRFKAKASTRKDHDERPRHDRLRDYVWRCAMFNNSEDAIVESAILYAGELFGDDPRRLAEEVADLPRGAAGAIEKIGPSLRMDDKAIARMICEHYDWPWMYVPETNHTYQWDDVSWTRCGAESMERGVDAYETEVLREDYNRCGDPDMEKRIMKMIGSLGGASKIANVCRLIRSLSMVSFSELNRDDDLLTFPACKELGAEALTYNLATDESYEPRQSDRITMVMGAPFVPGHQNIHNNTFWKSSFPVEEERSKVQEFFSLSMLNRPAVEKVYCLHGAAASGKGTLGYATLAMMGDYGGLGSPESIGGSARFGGGSDFSLTGWIGKRYIYIDEFSGVLGDRAKKLTQAGVVDIAIKYVPEAATVPITWTVVISNNTLPTISGGDKGGMKRRLLPFAMDGGSKDRVNPDSTIKDAMLYDMDCRAAFTQTLIAGLRRARALEFRIVESAATLALKDEWTLSTDLINAWYTSDNGVAHSENEADVLTHLYTRYKTWMGAEEGVLSKRDGNFANAREFKNLMLERGHTVTRTKLGTGFTHSVDREVGAVTEVGDILPSGVTRLKPLK